MCRCPILSVSAHTHTHTGKLALGQECAELDAAKSRAEIEASLAAIPAFDDFAFFVGERPGEPVGSF